MRLPIAALVLAATLGTTSPALSWELQEMNKAIDQTNVIVDKKCSGTLISVTERLVLTNYHCVDNKITSVEHEIIGNDGWVKKVKARRYAEVPVEQHGYDGFAKVMTTSYVAEIVAENKARDLALLKIKGSIPHVYASPLLPDGEDVVRGERVYVVGNPAMNESSLVEGIVSNMNRTFEFPWTGNEKLPMIQFSGGIFGGNSGGALYNAKGQLIGVPAAGHMGANFIGLAIPSKVVHAFLVENCFVAASATSDVAPDAACLEKKKAKKDAAKEKKETD